METREHVSWRMSRIRGKDTKPELTVRRLAYAMGYRYRLHCKEVKGKPDLVFKGRRKAIFVHGCFWHSHESADCRIAHIPKSNSEFWRSKLDRNKSRDEMVQRALTDAGWTSLVIWECQLKNLETLAVAVRAFLDSPDQ